MSKENPKENFLLHHLDDPLRLLYWTLDEAMALVIPIFLGIGFERPFWGLLWGGVLYKGLRSSKKHFGRHVLSRGLYWLLPPSKRLKGLAPSHMREVLA